MQKNYDRFRKIKKSDYTELKENHDNVKNSPYRQQFHIEPLTGLLNDPNGFSYYKDRWHLFYQWFPFGPIHGVKAWYHLESENLVNFTNRGLAISPDKFEDNSGAYSGSALEIDGKLNLYYTGNNKVDSVRHPYQMLTKFDGESFSDKKILIMENASYTEHQRDPKIIFNNKDSNYYILLGSQTKDKKGCIIIYKSTYPDKDFKFLGQLKVQGYEDFGYMWECPDLFSVRGMDVLAFSPQGIEKKGDLFNNIYQNGYLVGKMDFDNLEFEVQSEFTEFDRGFDFYASQTANQSDNDNTYLIAWMGLPEINYPSEEHGYVGSLTLTRKLFLKDSKLYQYPVDAYKNLRFDRKEVEGKNISSKMNPATEIELKSLQSSFSLKLFDDRISNFLLIEYDKDEKIFSMDRSYMKEVFATDYGTVRKINDIDVKELSIFIDRSSVEIFVNGGEYSMSARVFPSEKESYLSLISHEPIEMTSWQMSCSIDDNFVL